MVEINHLSDGARKQSAEIKKGPGHDVNSRACPE